MVIAMPGLSTRALRAPLSFTAFWITASVAVWPVRPVSFPGSHCEALRRLAGMTAGGQRQGAAQGEQKVQTHAVVLPR